MNKYEWLPTESSPKMYPMNIYKGTLFLEDGSTVYIPSSGISNETWGHIGSTHIQGKDAKAIPVKLEISWASFMERKFYKGSWDLPVEKIKELFNKGIINWRSGEKENYSYIITGCAPGGVVVVWMYGGDQQIEIARFQAKETEISMADYVPGNPTISRDTFFDISSSVPEAYENLKKKGIPYGIWDTYREKYRWKPEINIPNYKLEHVIVEMFNGEMETLFGAALNDNQFKLRAVPRYFSFLFSNSNGDKYVFEVKYADEQEMFELFKNVDKTKPVEIILKMNGDFSGRQLIFKQENKEIFIKKIDLDNFWKYQE
ncbi:DUF2931 family protein [Chryseobacterium sp. JK1]|uniref:DUF2931 family protein n=1 Tax=Chryseobacterium sp. JK1 TaxID=874294 RepID=UPI003D6932D9